MKVISSFLILLFLTSAYSEEFKPPSSGDIITIKFTAKDEYTERHEKVTFLTATDTSVMFEDKAGKRHILTKGYINIEFRKLFWEKDWEDSLKAKQDVQQQLKVREWLKEEYKKLSELEKSAFDKMNKSYSKLGSHIKGELEHFWKLHSENVNDKYYQEAYHYWKKASENLKRNVITYENYTNIVFRKFYNIKVFQVIDKSNVLINYSSKGFKQSDPNDPFAPESSASSVKTYLLSMDTSSLTDGNVYTFNNHFLSLGPQTYDTITGSVKTVESYQEIPEESLKKVYKLLKIHRGFK